MLSQLIRYRWTIWFFARRQIQDRYAGTWGGLAWAVLHPLMLLAVFWFVFEKGLRIASAGETPFVLHLFCGLVPWMLMQECLSAAASSITGRAYLVKKVAFPSEILPFTHLLAALLTHAVLMLILLALFAWHGHVPGAHALVLFPYYLACLLALAGGLSILLSAANVFYRDIGQILAVVLNVWFWLTPIVWPPHLLPPAYAWVLELNPLNYVIQGYRDALLGAEARMPALGLTAGFWLFTGALCLYAYRMFLRLKPSFADFL
jgi:lipopolysaccharide transport system permease protein/teichoic acid transport system permease protein